jgi:hypothetical protein
LNRILGGFLELESRSFWLDTIPLLECKAGSRAMSAQHPMWCPAQYPRNVRNAVTSFPRPQSGHDHDHRLSACNPRSRPFRSRVHVQSVAADYPRSWPVHVRAQAQSATNPRTIREQSKFATCRFHSKSSQLPCLNPLNDDML